jgi:branched-chain amino acid transport system substrate-binding protein
MLLAACTPAPAPTTAPAAQATKAPAAAEKTFKLGVMAPYTGPNARTGAEFKGGSQMAFEAINYKIGNYKIELVWVDEQSDPAKTVQAYEQAIVQDKIQAGILNWHSSDAVAAMDIAAKYKIPHFFGFGATELINEKYASDPVKYSYWMGKTWPSPSKLSIAYVIALEDAIKAGTFKPKNPASKTAYVWGEDNDWGRSFGKAVKKQLQDAGWKIVGEDYVPLDQTEFYPFLTKVKTVDPDILVGTSGVPPLVSALIKQHDELGVRALLIDDGLGWVGEWYEITGKSSNYVVDQIPQFASEKAKKWAADFKTKYGIDPSPSAGGQVYDMTNFFIKIAETPFRSTAR